MTRKAIESAIVCVAVGFGIVGVLSGCTRRSQSLQAPVRPQPVYVDVSAVIASHPVWKKGVAPSNWQATHVPRASVVLSPQRLPRSLSLDSSSTATATISVPDSRRERLAHIYASKLREQEALLRRLETTLNHEVRAREQVIEAQQKGQMEALQERLAENVEDQVKNLPARPEYADPAATLQLREVINRRTEDRLRKTTLQDEAKRQVLETHLQDRREQLRKERNALQEKWLAELSNIYKNAEETTATVRNNLEQSRTKTLATARQDFSKDVLGVAQSRLSRIEGDLAHAGGDRQRLPVLVDFMQVPTTRSRVTRDPSTSDMARFRKERQEKEQEQARKETAALQRSVAQDTRKHVLAIANEHHWVLMPAATRDIPDRTRVVIEKLHRKVWQQQRHRL